MRRCQGLDNPDAMPDGVGTSGRTVARVSGCRPSPADMVSR